MPFKHVALLGLGLIASSIALALRERFPEIKITGFSRSEKTRKKVKKIGFCQVHDTVANCVSEAVTTNKHVKAKITMIKLSHS